MTKMKYMTTKETEKNGILVKEEYDNYFKQEELKEQLKLESLEYSYLYYDKRIIKPDKNSFIINLNDNYFSEVDSIEIKKTNP